MHVIYTRNLYTIRKRRPNATQHPSPTMSTPGPPTDTDETVNYFQKISEQNAAMLELMQKLITKIDAKRERGRPKSTHAWRNSDIISEEVKANKDGLKASKWRVGSAKRIKMMEHRLGAFRTPPKMKWQACQQYTDGDKDSTELCYFTVWQKQPEQIMATKANEFCERFRTSLSQFESFYKLHHANRRKTVAKVAVRVQHIRDGKDIPSDASDDDSESESESSSSDREGEDTKPTNKRKGKQKSDNRKSKKVKQEKQNWTIEESDDETVKDDTDEKQYLTEEQRDTLLEWTSDLKGELVYINHPYNYKRDNGESVADVSIATGIKISNGVQAISNHPGLSKPLHENNNWLFIKDLTIIKSEKSWSDKVDHFGFVHRVTKFQKSKSNKPAYKIHRQWSDVSLPELTEWIANGDKGERCVAFYWAKCSADLKERPGAKSSEVQN